MKGASFAFAILALATGCGRTRQARTPASPPPVSVPASPGQTTSTAATHPSPATKLTPVHVLRGDQPAAAPLSPNDPVVIVLGVGKFDVTALTYSPDGRRLAAGYGSGMIRLWDVAAGKVRRELAGHKAAVSFVAFSPDGRLLVSGDEGSGEARPAIKLRDVRSGRVKQTLSEGSGAYSASFSPDSRTLAVGTGIRGIQLWDTRTWRFKRTLKNGSAGSNFGRFAVFSPDGRILVTVFVGRGKGRYPATNRSEVVLFDTATWRRKAALGAGDVNDATFSPDGTKLVVAGSDEWGYTPELHAVDLRTGKEQTVGAKMMPGPVEYVAFSPDGDLLAVGSRQKLERLVPEGEAFLGSLQDTRTGKQRAEFPRYEGHELTFSPDGKTMATASGSDIKLWRVPRR